MPLETWSMRLLVVLHDLQPDRLKLRVAPGIQARLELCEVPLGDLFLQGLTVLATLDGFELRVEVFELPVAEDIRQSDDVEDDPVARLAVLSCRFGLRLVLLHQLPDTDVVVVLRDVAQRRILPRILRLPVL